MPIVAVGKPLREKLGDDGVDALVELINKSNADQKNNILEFVEEKFGRRLAEEIGGVEGRLTAKILETKAELIKWMFIFWVGQVGVMLGILFVFFK
jgi:hypothetical protein